MTGFQYLGRSGSGVLVLTSVDPVPPGTPDGTLIARTLATPDPVVVGTPTTNGALSANSVAINKPSGIVAGETLVAFINQSLSGTTVTGPSGWTKRHEVLGSAWAAMRTTEIWTLHVPDPGTLPASFTWSFSAGGRIVGTIMRIANVDSANPVSGVSPVPTAARELPAFSVASNNSLTVFAGVTIAVSPNVLDPLTLSSGTPTKIGFYQSSASSSDTRQGLTIYSVPVGTGGQPSITYTSPAPAANETAIGLALRKA